jgi:hypothetical protein
MPLSSIMECNNNMFSFILLNQIPLLHIEREKETLKHSYPTLNVYGNCHFMQVVLVHVFVTSC